MLKHNKVFLKAGFVLLMMVGGTCPIMADVATLKNSQGDQVRIFYDICWEENGQTTITFHPAGILPSKHSELKQYIDNKSLKVIFIDGKNFEDGQKVDNEDGNITLNELSVPHGWNYVPQNSSGKNHIFVINNTGENRLTFEGSGKQKLKIPIYLAEYEHNGERKVWKATLRHSKSTYHILSELEPLEIVLSNKPVKSHGSSSSTQQAGKTSIEVEDDVIIESEEDDGLQPAFNEELEKKALELKRSIESQLENCETPEDYERLKNDIENLRSYSSGVSPETRNQIEGITKKFDNDSRNAIAAAQAKAEKEAEEAAEDEIKKQEEEGKKDREQLWWMFGITALLGVLGFGTSQITQHLRNKNMENMQRKMVQQAKNEAKRRGQSIVRNKTHQMVGQAKQKGRQAVRSGVTQLGENVKGKKNSPNVNTPGSQDTNANRSTRGKRSSTNYRPDPRRPKPGENGQISI